MNIKLLSGAAVILLLAGCGSAAKPAAHTSRTAPAVHAVASPVASSAAGPYVDMTGVQLGNALCTDWTKVRAAYMTAPWQTAAKVIMASKLHKDAVAMDNAEQSGGAGGYSGAIGAAIVSLQTAPLSRSDRATSEGIMNDACRPGHQ